MTVLFPLTRKRERGACGHDVYNGDILGKVCVYIYIYILYNMYVVYTVYLRIHLAKYRSVR